MAIRKVHYWILLVSLLAATVSSLFYFNGLRTLDSRGLLFLSIGVNQKLLPNESSSYELQRASEHFSDLVLGWVAEPSFSLELDSKLTYHLNFSGVRQEKQNLIFNLSGDSTSFNSNSADVFLSLIEGRILEYDSKTNASYVVALSRYTDLDPVSYSSRVFFGIALLTFLSTAIVLTALEYAIKNCGRFAAIA